MLGAAVLITILGMITMYAFHGEGPLFSKQLISLLVALIACVVCAQIDFRFLRNTRAVVAIFLISLLSLALLFLIGHVSKGAESWFRLGGFSFEPADPATIALIILLSKYFSRRHIEIRNLRHIAISGVYAFTMFFLIFIQPDFGSAVIIFILWFGMVLVSGISYKHIAVVFSIGIIVTAGLWGFVFKEYQKQRIETFIHPLADIRGAGYNAYQSMIAVGSGGFLGKGIGYGTQSRLKFLPEYQTDFIFAAFAEEWGFVGALILLGLFLVVLWRVLHYAMRGQSNFESLFGFGVAILLIAHAVVNIGMNIGLLPVTGVPMPFMSFGGSHLLTEYIALGIIMGMSKYSRTIQNTQTLF